MYAYCASAMPRAKQKVNKRSILKEADSALLVFLLICLWFYCTHGCVYSIQEKAKVIAAAWGAELIQFLVALVIFHQDDLKTMMNCTRTIWRIGLIHPFLQIILVQNCLHVKELNLFCPPNSSDNLSFSSVFILLWFSPTPPLQSCQYLSREPRHSCHGKYANSWI